MTHERGNPLAFRSPLMLDDFELDSERSRDWSATLVQYAVGAASRQCRVAQAMGHALEPAVVLEYGSVGRTLRASTSSAQPEAVAAAKVRAALSLRSEYG